MCTDQVTGSGHPAPGLTRRHFLHGTAALAGAGVLLRQAPRVSRLPLRSAARPVTYDGTSAYSMAMHVHTSFSEQDGSMDSQLYQATANSVDVVWWTDHDHRMDGSDFRDTVHFTSLTKEQGAPGQGGAWVWAKQQSGPAASASGGGIVKTPCSPNDPVAGGSLHLAAQSKTTAAARYGYYGNCQPAGWNYRDNLTGQSLSIDVLLSPGWSRGYLELLIGTSYHQASAGRPAGDYSLSYRFLPPAGQSSRTAQGNTGIITIPVQPPGGGWTTVTITPSSDIAALWPDLDYRDFSLWELTLNAVSTGDLVTGYFDYLQFNRTISGEAYLQQQADMGSSLAARYPSVIQQQGLEVSGSPPHINWFGNVTIPDYGSPTASQWISYLTSTLIPQIHEAGGLVSYNHPYGTSFTQPALSAASQDAQLSQVAAALLPTGTAPAALGADLLEVGYPLRQGVDLAHHVALWDVMSRNAVFLTGNGVNDDHYGQNWLTDLNNWATSAWAASTAQADLQAALAAGRAWCGALPQYPASLDLLVDGSCPMGSASVSAVTSRQLTVTATGIPANGSLAVLQGAVDYAGTADPTASTHVIATYPAAELTSGSVTLPVDTSADSFVRTQILNSSGTTVGLSNPVWLLQNQPPNGIPDQRAT